MNISGSYLTINLKNLEHNLKVIKSKLNAKCKIIPVVKANGYGSDSIIIAKKLVELGVERIAVASFNEASILKKSGIKISIMIFYPNFKNINLIIKENFEIVIYSKHLFEIVSKKINALKIKSYPVHLKFNSGLNRLGLEKNEIKFILNSNKIKSIDILSIYSHLGCSENKRPCKYTDKQIELFDALIKELSKLTQPRLGFHLLNTSGVFNYPKKQYDSVRIGLGLYGYSNNFIWDKELKPVFELKSPIIQIRKVSKGKYVGYDFGHKTEKDSIIACVPIGHADGINRNFGRKDINVLVNNKKCSIIGNICMDILMIDVTNVVCKTGDFVYIFGPKNSASKISKKAGTISYELLSGISNRIIRKIIY